MTTIKDPGPPVSEADVAALEQRLGLRIPVPFRAFLLRFNGGKPSPNVVDVGGYAGSPTDVQVVFGVGREVESSGLEWNVRTLAERFGATYLPVACDSGGCIFGVSLRDADFGRVYFFDLDAVYGDLATPPPEYPVAADVDEFLGRLREF